MHLYIHIVVNDNVSGQDAVKALVNNRLNASDPRPLEAGECGSIRDDSGQRIGSWHVQEYEHTPKPIGDPF